MTDGPRIVVAGAGAIGCFTGGLLAAAGHDVTLLVRPRIGHEIRAHGLTLTDFGGLAETVRPEDLAFTQDARCLAQADVILVTVKTRDTADIARSIATHGAAGACVISLQNGVTNATTLRDALPGRDVRAAMVPFNVVPMGQGCYHRATSGNIVLEAGPADWAARLSVPHLQWEESDDILGVQWGKFLVNLTNALNALSGLTLQDMLRDRQWRRVMAAQWAEALRVLRAEGIRPVSTTPVPVGAIPHILRLPTPLFTRIAASMLTIDAQARSSMAYDLMEGRPTEIDALQGEVVRMGAAQKRPVPICRHVTEVMHLAELAQEGLPHLPPSALWPKKDRA